MSDQPLAIYLAACARTRATALATGETAYYPTLQRLLESAGGGLRPRVFPVFGLRDQATRRLIGGRPSGDVPSLASTASPSAAYASMTSGETVWRELGKG